MIDITPEVFRYIRLMENLPVIGTQYEYQREDGSIVKTVAMHSTTNCNKQVLADVSEQYYSKVKYESIEILASDIECKRIEKIIRTHVNEDNPAFNEVRNSLVLFYNGLIDEVEEYHNNCKAIKGTGNKVGQYETLPDYYREVHKCYNLIKSGCNGISLDIINGEISKVILIDKRNRKLQLPIFKDGAELESIEIRLQTLYIDPKDRFEDIPKFTLSYTPESNYLYTFDEVQANLIELLRKRMEHEVIGTPKKNNSRQKFYQRLDCIYRYVMNNRHIEISDGKSKTNVIEFIVRFLKVDGEQTDRKYNFVDYVTISNYVGQTADIQKVDFKINHYKSIRKQLGKLNKNS